MIPVVSELGMIRVVSKFCKVCPDILSLGCQSINTWWTWNVDIGCWRYPCNLWLVQSKYRINLFITYQSLTR